MAVGFVLRYRSVVPIHASDLLFSATSSAWIAKGSRLGDGHANGARNGTRDFFCRVDVGDVGQPRRRNLCALNTQIVRDSGLANSRRARQRDEAMTVVEMCIQGLDDLLPTNERIESRDQIGAP